MSNNYPSSEAAFKIIQNEYEYELNRSTKLDNKISITLTFCGVLFLFILRYLDIWSLIEIIQNSSTGRGLPLTSVACIIGQVVIVVLFLRAILKLFFLLKTSTYLHVNCDVIFDKNLAKESPEVLQMYMAAKYLAATNENNKTNENRSSQYASALPNLVGVIIACTVVELLKINILGLGG